MTKHSEINGQIKAIEAAHEQIEDEYMSHLRSIAHDDLTAYSEYMHPDEPPAEHHMYLCDKLMTLEQTYAGRLIISAPPGTAKPVHKDELIHLADGSYTPISEIKIGDKVMTKEGRFKKVIAVHKQGKLPVWEIVTQSGRTIRAAADHPFLTPSGWKNVEEIKEWDILGIKHSWEVEDTSERSIEEFRLAGFLVGDGSVTKYWHKQSGTWQHNFSLTNKTPEVLVAYKECCKAIGITVSPAEHTSGTATVLSCIGPASKEWLLNSELYGLGSYTKVTPSWVFKGSNEKIAAYLGAYFDCDGSVHKRAQKGGRKLSGTMVEITSVSKKLMKEYQLLLERLGIPSLVKERTTKYKYKDGRDTCYYYRLTVGSEHECSIFKDTIPLLGYKNERIEEYNPTKIKWGYPPYFEDKVLSCKKTRKKNEMYCLTVEDDASFTVSNVVVHNSTYCSRDYPSWYLGRHPTHSYMQGGHTQGFCDDELSVPTRGLVDSSAFRDIFPGIHLDPQKKAATMWRLNTKKGRYFCRGVGGGISGYRTHCAGLDDPYPTRKMAESPAYSNEVYTWFNSDFKKRLLPSAPLFIIATRWNPHDLTGRLLELMQDKRVGQYEVVNLAGLALENDPIGRKEGDPLWPEMFDKAYYLTQKAESTASEWHSLYQGQPTVEDGGVLQSEWIQRYKDLPTHEGRPPPPPNFEESHEQQAERLRTIDPDSIIVRTTLSVDTAIKASDRANYTAITVWAESKSGKHYLIEVYRRRLEFNTMVDIIDKAARDHNVSAILVEDKGSGTQYIQTQQNKSFAPIISISVQNQTKEFRFDAITPMFVTGRVLLPHSGLWLPDYEKELLEFPASKYDDQVDSTSQYLSWAKPMARGGMKPLRGGV